MKIVCDATNNTPESLALGYLNADLIAETTTEALLLGHDEEVILYTFTIGEK